MGNRMKWVSLLLTSLVLLLAACSGGGILTLHQTQVRKI